jgi:hypothetical protein
MSHSATPPEDLGLDVLAHRCAEETERFFRTQISHDEFCFELLRRALVLRSSEAWERIYVQYRTLIVGWIQRHPSFPKCNEEIHFFVNGTFARIWKWCTPTKFDELAILPKVLAYFRACVYSDISEYYRQHVELGQIEDGLDAISDQLPASLQPIDLLESSERENFWQILQERLLTDHERLLVEYHFVLGYKPREIYALLPQKFADVKEVYRLKENLIRRLRRDPALRQFFPDEYVI